MVILILKVLDRLKTWIEQKVSKFGLYLMNTSLIIAQKEPSFCCLENIHRNWVSIGNDNSNANVTCQECLYKHYVTNQ